MDPKILGMIVAGCIVTWIGITIILAGMVRLLVSL